MVYTIVVKVEITVFTRMLATSFPGGVIAGELFDRGMPQFLNYKMGMTMVSPL